MLITNACTNSTIDYAGKGVFILPMDSAVNDVVKCDFRPISRYMPETVQNMDRVTAKVE